MPASSGAWLNGAVSALQRGYGGERPSRGTRLAARIRHARAALLLD